PRPLSVYAPQVTSDTQPCPTRRSSDLRIHGQGGNECPVDRCCRPARAAVGALEHAGAACARVNGRCRRGIHCQRVHARIRQAGRSEEHTSELQSQSNLVCRLVLEKKKVKAYALFTTVMLAVLSLAAFTGSLL